LTFIFFREVGQPPTRTLLMIPLRYIQNFLSDCKKVSTWITEITTWSVLDYWVIYFICCIYIIQYNIYMIYIIYNSTYIHIYIIQHLHNSIYIYIYDTYSSMYVYNKYNSMYIHIYISFNIYIYFNIYIIVYNSKCIYIYI
jgi:hypothetical protein